jgi:hypothetical protein
MADILLGTRLAAASTAAIIDFCPMQELSSR